MSDDAKKPTDPSQDPLAVLENILKDAKNQPAKAKSDPATGVSKPAVTELSDEEKQALAEKHAQEQEALEAERQKQIEQYRKQMQGTIQQTDAYKARVSQDEEEKGKTTNMDDPDGFTIKQLDHKKI